MQTKNNKLYDVSAELDSIFGAPGTDSLKAAENQAWREAFNDRVEGQWKVGALGRN